MEIVTKRVYSDWDFFGGRGGGRFKFSVIYNISYLIYQREIAKGCKCSYMGWTYGVMGETKITATRANVNDGYYPYK